MGEKPNGQQQMPRHARLMALMDMHTQTVALRQMIASGQPVEVTRNGVSRKATREEMARDLEAMSRTMLELFDGLVRYAHVTAESRIVGVKR